MVCTGMYWVKIDMQVRMEGSDGRTDLRLSRADSLAMYHRTSTRDEGSILFVGMCSAFVQHGVVRGIHLQQSTSPPRGI